MLPELFSKVPKIQEIGTPTMLTSLAVSGVASTTYLTGRASFKAARLIDHDQHLRDEEAGGAAPVLSRREMFKLTWILYLPAASVGATTIVAIVLANHEASKKIAALTVATGISDRAFQEYKAKVVEKLGENKEMAIRDEVAQDRVAAEKGSNEVIIIDGEVLCFDMATGRYFKSSMEKIRAAENTVNHDILNHMYASLSSFYDEIGLAPTPYSDTVGWNSLREMVDVQYSTVMSPDGRPCIAIDFVTPPYPEYDRTW